MFVKNNNIWFNKYKNNIKIFFLQTIILEKNKNITYFE